LRCINLSFKAAAWAIDSEAVQTAYQKLVLIILADCHNADTGRCDPSIEFIAARAKISRRSVERAIDGLESLGLLKRKQRSNRDGLKTSNSYVLAISDASESRIDASHSRIRCVTQAEWDASDRRINQEVKNQEENLGARKRATPIPADFRPDPALVAWARSEIPGVDLARETARFVDYHAAKGSTFKDHKAAWRNWMRKAAEFAPQTSTPSRIPML
jgi:DNA-binding MarR family transcriptional regulator